MGLGIVGQSGHPLDSMKSFEALETTNWYVASGPFELFATPGMVNEFKLETVLRRLAQLLQDLNAGSDDLRAYAVAPDNGNSIHVCRAFDQRRRARSRTLLAEIVSRRE